MSRFNQQDYISLTMEFRCNLKCVHCMIEDTMDELEPQSMEAFRGVLKHNKETAQWKGIILTGSEITLRKDLLSLVREAKEAGFEHVRIQTHGMHLGQQSFCDSLLDVGVDEFFISVAGCDAQSHDAITEVPGSFEKMYRGMEYLDSFDHVALITNTVVTKLSYQLLPDLVDKFSKFKRLAQMEFWNYWPMKELDEKGLIARHGDVAPYLMQAVEKAQNLGRCVEVKNFPECLMGEHSGVLVNDQPELLIDPNFWVEFNRNGFSQCAYGHLCTSQKCLGLNGAYTAKYGWEKSLLSPINPNELIARTNS